MLQFCEIQLVSALVPLPSSSVNIAIEILKMGVRQGNLTYVLLD